MIGLFGKKKKKNDSMFVVMPGDEDNFVIVDDTDPDDDLRYVGMKGIDMKELQLEDEVLTPGKRGRRKKSIPLVDDDLSHPYVEVNDELAAENSVRLADANDSSLLMPPDDADTPSVPFGTAFPRFPQSETFSKSVQSFKPDKSKINSGNDNKRLIKSLLANSIVLVACFSVFLYCGYLIVLRVIDNALEDEAYDEIRVDSNAESEVARSSKLAQPTAMLTLYETLNTNEAHGDYVIDDTETVSEYRKYYENYLAVKAKYPDVYAWITVSNTGVDYPLMRGDVNYYLCHNYKGHESSSGSICTSEYTNPDYLSNLNIVTYGHSMTHGTMYRGLKLWYDSVGYRNSAKTMKIYVYREEGLYIYDLFSAYRTAEGDTEFYRELFSNVDKTDFTDWLDRIYGLSTLDNRFEYSENSRMITLITCTNTTDKEYERYAIHGILSKMVSAEDILNS